MPSETQQYQPLNPAAVDAMVAFGGRGSHLTEGGIVKEIVKPWYCVLCWAVYHDHDGSFLAALKAGKPTTCNVAQAPEISPSQSSRCGGEIHPLAWP